MKIKECKFNELFNSLERYLASYYIFGNWSPAVWKNKEGEYGIRIIKNLGRTHREWEYFELDKAGLITSTPRGMTKQFKNIRIIDIDEMVEFYKDKKLNEGI
ncbi:MAG: hypothetical protein PHP92_03850 [Candidatus Nanoarchaeia archaeon]|nr:hypothetical protein [Candidatus Nanoarchaeia archaeon]